MIDFSPFEGNDILQEREKNLFSLIRDVCASFSPPAIARVAGGWVRDKLLGLSSDDFDITLENCTGAEFASKLSEIFEAKGEKFSKIETPDQSKHLSTSKVCLFGDTWIDLCSLRSEKYNELSRIPEVSVGTPLQDAQRRDFTINTLFFNICTNKVEDFFHGKEDLEAGIIRTPIDASVSFSEDPLRILRALRFASRFNFKYDDTILPAISASHDVYLRKVTAERAAIEVQKALDGPNPLRFVREVIDSGFFFNIFDRGNELNLNPEDVYKKLEFAVGKFGSEMRLSIILASVYSTEYGKGYVDSKKYGKKVDHIDRAISRILRMPTRYCGEARSLLTAAFALKKVTEISVLSVGHAIREGGEHWKLGKCLLFDEEKYKFVNEKVIPFAEENNLCDAWSMHPILNGNQLSELHNTKGSKLREIQKQMIDWQLEHIGGCADDYIAFVKSKK